jgi:hypothetical protein
LVAFFEAIKGGCSANAGQPFSFALHSQHVMERDMPLRSGLSILASTALLLLAACGPADNDPGPGGVTAGDAAALDEAAQKLDERDQVEAKKAAK